MSQRAVEAVLGRLITDVEFRRRFFAEPVAVCREDDIVLTARETTALLQVNLQALNSLTAKLDPKIVRAAGPHVRRLGGGYVNEMRADRAEDRPAPVLRREELDRRGER